MRFSHFFMAAFAGISMCCIAFSAQTVGTEGQTVLVADLQTDGVAAIGEGARLDAETPSHTETNSPEETPEPAEGENDIETQMMYLVLQLGVILFAAKLGGTIATLCRLPSVIGELGIGIIIGPHLLGSFPIGTIFPQGIFPLNPDSFIPVSNALYGFCTLASIILLFLSGLETNFKMFLRYAFSGSIVGIGGVIISFLAGDLCAVYLLPKFISAYQGVTLTVGHPAALFMGIISTATSVGITARILSERKVIDSPEGTTTMSAAVIDDVLGIIILAVGMSVIAAEKNGSGASGISWTHIGGIALKAICIWIGGTAVGLLAARKISFLLKFLKTPVAIATLAFALAIAVSGIFQMMGLSLIIGAYVMGLALSRTDIRYLIQDNLQPIYTFLVPIFFCVMGMMVDIHAISSKPILIFGSIYTLLAILAKIFGCATPAAFCGFNLRGSLRVGVGMIPRGEVALIIASIGLSSGVLQSDIFSICILMTLVTTVVAPPGLIALFSSPKTGRRHQPTEENTSKPFSYPLPNADTASLLLDKLIDVFRKEGFQTANLNPTENIWQIMREEDDIMVSLHDNELRFECSDREKPFLVAALREVTQDLQNLASSLSIPSADLNKMMRNVFTADRSTPIETTADNDLRRYLKNFLYLPNEHAGSKEEAIRRIVRIFSEKNLLQDTDTAVDLILKRETSMSSGIEHGIAIPHARTDFVEGLIGAVAVFPDGIPEYETLDHSKVRIVIVSLTSRSTHSPQIRLLSFISQLLNEEGRKRLLDAKSEEEMRKIFLS